MADKPGPFPIDAYFEDSDCAELTASEAPSLCTSITDYIYENGRRYHAYRAGAYWGSNDKESVDAMDILHHVYTILLHGNLFLAPLPADVKQVLDVGTGSGSWALDFADLYPSSSVTSTDLSPILPRWLPPNLKFEVDDCQEEWIYHEPFDFIHVRGLYGSVRDWDQFYLQALQNLRPGGYLEQVEGGIVIESDDGSADNTAMREIGTLGLQAGDKFGKSLRVIDEMKNGMINAGFVDVTEHSFKVPIGPWPKDRYLKEIGQYMRLVWDESLEMWTMMLLTKILGWSREEVDIKLADVREDLYNKNIHGYNRAKVVYGRRPTTEESARQATV